MEQNFTIILKRVTIFRLMIYDSFRAEFRGKAKKWFEEFISLLSYVSIPIEGVYVTLSINWEGLINEFIRSINTDIPIDDFIRGYEKKLESLGNEEVYTIQEYIDEYYYNFKKLSELVEVKGRIKHNGEKINTPDYLKITLFHIWRCSNISFPGILNFYNANLCIEGTESVKLELSVDWLEDIYNWDLNKKYRPIRILSVIKTWNWYNAIIDTRLNHSANKFDRALTSLFSFIRSESFVQSNIINLFLGIESFYSLGGSDILTRLKNRSVSYLQVIDHKKGFKKEISSFYNYRSRYVHGDCDLILYMDILDNLFTNEHKYYDEVQEISKFGVYFLILSLQKAIEEGREELIFDEIIRDNKISVDDVT